MAEYEDKKPLGVTVNDPIVFDSGQRRCGPPCNWTDLPPEKGCEVFVAKIPKYCYEITLIPIFKTVGEIYMFRLMMEDEINHKGFGFCTYTSKTSAKEAVLKLNNYEIKKNWFLGICFSVDNCRLFVGGIPKMKIKSEILEEMKKVTDNVIDIIMYPSAADKNKNRGFAFVEYTDHKSAAVARKKMIGNSIQLWGHNIAVDWAEPERKVDEETMSKVKILYVRNLMLTTSEDTIHQTFSKFTNEKEEIVRVKKMEDFAFVHFKNRDQAEIARLNLDGSDLEGSKIEVHFAKPANKLEQQQRLIKKSNTTFEKASPTKSINEEQNLFLDECNNEFSNMMSPAINGICKSYRNAAGRCSIKSKQIIKNSEPNNYVQLLTHICHSYGWDIPFYTIQVIPMMHDSNISVFIAQVFIPGLYCHFSSKVSSFTYKDAIADASESALLWMFYNGIQAPLLLDFDQGNLNDTSINEKECRINGNNEFQLLPITLTQSINSSLFNSRNFQPSDAYMHQWQQYSSVPSYNKCYFQQNNYIPQSEVADSTEINKVK